MVYSFLLLIMALKRLFMILVLNTSRTNVRLKEWTFEIAYCCTVLNFELAWYIYGNTFHWSSDGMACKELNSDARALWVLMTIILVWGYFHFVFFLLILVWSILIFFKIL